MSREGKRNILWIMTDQQKSTALSCISGPPHMTDCLDAFAEDSVLFENAYTPCPVCGPARASLKTGLYPPATGIVRNWVGFKEGISFLPEELRKAGYQTGMAGKLHFYPPEKPEYGFEITHLSDAPYSVYSDDPDHSEYVKWLRANYHDRSVDPVDLFNEDELSYDDDLKRFILGSGFRTEKEHETRWTEECTLDFLRSHDRSRPFFFYCSYFGPHQPYKAPAPYDSWIDPGSIELPRSFLADYKKGCPVFERNTRKIYDHIRESISEDDAREVIAQYCGQVRMIDESIGRILSYMKESGLYDDTLIIFSSDHGDHLGEHGLFFKGQMYDSCVKVPLIVKLPGKAEGRRCGRVVNTIDLYSTLIEFSGAENRNEGIESKSLMPLLLDSQAEWRDESFSIIGDDREHAMTMLRDGNLKLIRYPDGQGAVYEMYDVEEDPEEIRDIYPSSCGAVRVIALRDRLDRWSAREIALYSR